MVDFNFTVNDIVKVNVATDDITLKTTENINKTSRFDENSSCKKLLSFAPIWDNFLDEVYLGENSIKINAI